MVLCFWHRTKNFGKSYDENDWNVFCYVNEVLERMKAGE